MFKNKLGSRVALAKTIGFVFGFIAFLTIPHYIPEADIMFRLGILFLYTTIGAFVGLFGIMDKHPVLKCNMPFWIRGPLVGALLNTLIILFSYTIFQALMIGTMIEGYSPFWFAFEGAIIGLIIDYIATKYCGEGKKLLK